MKTNANDNDSDVANAALRQKIEERAVFEEFERRKAVVYVHPSPSPDAVAHSLGLPDNLLDFPADTNRAILAIKSKQQILQSSELNDSERWDIPGGSTSRLLPRRFRPSSKVI